MRTQPSPTIRVARTEDAARISELAGQLGYPGATAETTRRLLEIRDKDEHGVFVAEAGDGVLGWIHIVVVHSLATDKRVEIAGLVVDESQRGRGIGRVLMEQAEHWAVAQECYSVRLRSNVVRSGAHTFYQKLGYRMMKTQTAFSKELGLKTERLPAEKAR
jgi:GNAT superfamily N-acetyltransferase